MKNKVRPLLTVPQMENKLQQKFKGKIYSFTHPAYNRVIGKVDEISLEYLREPIVVIQMNDKRYTCSLESIPDCLKLLADAQNKIPGTGILS